jgi:hypothetical protein
MGVSKSMKIFTEAMQAGMSTSGYGSKIVNTAMGPFKWDDNLQVWVNVNNGFQMPNISLQDMYLYDYDVSIGNQGYRSTTAPSPCTETIGNYGSSSITIVNDPSSNRTSITGLFSPTITCPQGIIIYLDNPNDYQVGVAGAGTELKFEVSTDSGSSWTELYPDITDRAGALITILPGQQIGSDVLIAVSPLVYDPTNWYDTGSYTFTLANDYDQTIIKTITIGTDGV